MTRFAFSIDAFEGKDAVEGSREAGTGVDVIEGVEGFAEEIGYCEADLGGVWWFYWYQIEMSVKVVWVDIYDPVCSDHKESCGLFFVLL